MKWGWRSHLVGYMRRLSKFKGRERGMLDGRWLFLQLLSPCPRLQGNTGWHGPGCRSRGTSPPHPTLGIWKPCSSAAHSSASKAVKAGPFHGLGGELHGLVHTLPPCSQWPGAPYEGSSWLTSGALPGSHQALRQLGGRGWQVLDWTPFPRPTCPQATQQPALRRKP